ncbi:MAG: glycosyltransferase family 4 protein [Anaerolineales bacterium]|nr:glycosyltransferase family 4 protein [Anaerolineales bacterium]
MSIIYSIGARFGGGGIGNTAHHAVKGYQRNNLLHTLLCGSYLPTEIPSGKIKSIGLLNRAVRKLASYDTTRIMDLVDSWLYDAWASRQLESASALHVWGNFGLRTIRKAAEMGMTIIVERASTHPVYQNQLLCDEYARWGLSSPQSNWIVQRAVKEMEAADYILVPSTLAHSTFVAAGIPPEKLLLVNFGVDLGRFQPGVASRGHFRSLFVGNVNLLKGVLYLLEAWKQLKWNDAELWIAGRIDARIAPLLRPYQNLPGIRFTGHVAQPVGLYQQADAFVFPTLAEGSALVVYEAMACGLPVVTTPNAGSVLRHEVDGFLTPIRDIEGIAMRLEQLRANPDLRVEMGYNARQQVLQFSWDAYGDRLSGTVKGILAGRS